MQADYQDGLQYYQDSGETTLLEEERRMVDYLTEIRNVARKYGYYELADKIRDELEECGIRLEDTKGVDNADL